MYPVLSFAAVLLRDHLVVVAWCALWGIGTVLHRLAKRVPVAGTGGTAGSAARDRARGVGLLFVGIAVAGELAPPPHGLIAGLPRTCDTDLGGLTWRSHWLQMGPRVPQVVVAALIGVAWCRSARLLGAAVGAFLAIEAVQWLVPGLGRVCSATDAVAESLALGGGAAAGLAVALLFRLCSRPGWPRRVVAWGSATVMVTTGSALAAITGGTATAGQAGPPLIEHAPTTASAPPGWLGGDFPGRGTAYEPMARAALTQLAITANGFGDPATALPVAGFGANWNYFWPRDGAFVAVALDVTGHRDDAVAMLHNLARLRVAFDPLYGFDARYLPSGGRVVLDPRRAQGDGCGWVLWAIHQTAPTDPALAGLRDRCTDQLVRATAAGRQLPPVSPDYWEQPTFDRLLGVSAPIALGLRSAAADYALLVTQGRGAGSAAYARRAARVADAAMRFRALIGRHFGPRFLRAGDHGGLDAAVAMLMPPFDPDPLPGVVAAWRAYQMRALRPAGGLAPGTAWRADGISWTPQVALVAYTAAADGDRATATHWLDWLDAHRSRGGTVPEKVTAAGQPAGPAYLAWSNALVLLTLARLR